MTRLTAALIIRDEAEVLPACLDSLVRLVDDIVVVDTGSTDDSVEIARRAGATVHHHPWQDDFASARNAALDACSGDWVLYIDADERVRGDGSDLGSLTGDDRIVAATVRFRPRRGFTTYRELRLFRNEPTLRFQGVIHETLWPALHTEMARTGRVVGESRLLVEHVGYDGDLEAKHRRNLPLLRRAVRAEPDHVYCWFQLGVTLLALGRDDEGVAALRTAAEIVRRLGPNRAADSLAFIELALRSADPADRERCVAEALELFPRDPMLRWLQARHELEHGRPEVALDPLVDLLAQDPDHVSDHFSYDRRDFTSTTHALVGAAHLRLDDPAAAVEHLQLACQLDPDDLQLRITRDLAVHLASRRPSDEGGAP